MKAKLAVRISIACCCLLSGIQQINAQSLDTSAMSRHYKRFTTRQLYASSAFIAAGVIASVKWQTNETSFDAKVCKRRNEEMSHFKTDVDDYLQFAPVALTYAFDAMGMKCKNDFANRTALALKSHLLMTAIVTSAKLIINTERPDKTGNNSFPSGHTAQAFVAATFMSEELGQRYKWTPYVAYTIASSVGVLRVLNNKHYVSDVLVGAGVGILATKLVYATHQYRWGKNKLKKKMVLG